MLYQDFPLRKIENAGRLLVPYLLLVFLMLLNTVSVPLLPTGAIKPQFALMVVYYWAIYRPTLLPVPFCFAAGLLTDILGGMTLGVNALILVLTHWIVRDQRRFLRGQSYGTIWAIFGFVSIASALIQWGLYGFAHMHWSALLPVLGSAALGMFMFPFATLLLFVAHRMLPVASRPYS